MKTKGRSQGQNAKVHILTSVRTWRVAGFMASSALEARVLEARGREEPELDLRTAELGVDLCAADFGAFGAERFC